MPDFVHPSDTFIDSVFLRPPRAKGESTGLSRDQIVRVAIELLDAEGPAGLSMRRLGTRLGSGATSAYWHVGNKDDLLELAVDQVLGEVYVPEAGDTGWRTGLSVLATGMRASVLRHPWVIGQLGVRPTLGPNAMRMGERTVALLTASGFTGVAVSHVLSTITAHALGSATTQSAINRAVERSGRSAQDLVAQVDPYLTGSADRYPEISRWRHESSINRIDPEQVWDESFTFGLERILDGLEMWLQKA